MSNPEIRKGRQAAAHVEAAAAALSDRALAGSRPFAVWAALRWPPDAAAEATSTRGAPGLLPRPARPMTSCSHARGKALFSDGD